MTNSDEPLAPLTPEERTRMAQAGANWSRDIQAGRDVVLAIYTPRAARGPKDGVHVLRDQRYGQHPRQVADLFVPRDARNCDVVVFVHGGAFVRGDKRINDEVYDNVGYWFARQGVLFVNLEYRLAADAPYPGGAEDVRLGVQWCVRGIEEHGGNPRRVFVIGHSAGATHVGTYLLDPVMGEGTQEIVAGAAFISGRLRADVRPDNPNAKGVRAYFGEDASRHDGRSPVTHAARARIPILVALAEFENPWLDVYSLEFAWRIAQARGRAPDVIRLRGHNHTSMMSHFNSGEDLLGRRILAFMKDCGDRGEG